MNTFDLLILGGGPGGYPLALRMAKHGWKVGLVDYPASVGGTCLNWGCIPTKALLASAQMYHCLKTADSYGFGVNSPNFDWSRIQDRKNAVVTRLRGGIEQLFKKNGVTFFPGRATLLTDTEIQVEFEGKFQKLQSKKIVLAIGSEPSVPAIFPQDRSLFWTSDEALHTKEIPPSLLIAGGGVIGLELGQVFAEFGAKVTVVEMMPQILPGLDTATAKRLLPVFRKLGLEILVGQKVEDLQETDSQVSASIAGEKRMFAKALLAIGRKVNLSCLHGSDLELNLENGKIKVNENFQTSVNSVFAIGDAVVGPMLAHKASYDAMILSQQFMGVNVKPSYKAVPSCVFTYPEVSWVGLSEQEAKEFAPNAKVGKFMFSANGKALASGESEGQIKTILDENGKLLGSIIWGPEASNLITEPTLMRQLDISAHDFTSVIHAHPTLAEAFLESVENALGEGVHG